MSKLTSYAAFILGTLLFVVGLGFVLIYFKDALILRWGEADQSLLFWYLPFLFAGLGSTLCGIVVFQSGLRKLKNMENK